MSDETKNDNAENHKVDPFQAVRDLISAAEAGEVVGFVSVVHLKSGEVKASWAMADSGGVPALVVGLERLKLQMILGDGVEKAK